MKYISIFLVMVLLTSCGHHADGTSVWAEGLWVVPVLLFTAAAIFFVMGFRSWRSGSKQMREGVGLVETDQNLRWFQIPFFWFAIVFALAAVAMIINVNWEA